MTQQPNQKREKKETLVKINAISTKRKSIPPSVASKFSIDENKLGF